MRYPKILFPLSNNLVVLFKSSHFLLFIILIISLVSSIDLSAQKIDYTERYSQELSGSAIHVGHGFEVIDDWYDWMQDFPTYWLNYQNTSYPFPNSIAEYHFINKNTRTYVGFRWDGSSNNVYDEEWHYRVEVEVLGWTDEGEYIESEQAYLSVNYIPGHGVEYQDWDILELRDAHNIQIQIVNVDAVIHVEYDEEGNIVEWETEEIGQIPDELEDLILEGIIEVERYHTIDQDEELNINGTANWTTHDINFTWNYLDGAQEYDLEWIYVSDELDGKTTQQMLDWRNATRVTTSTTNYEIETIYNRGDIFYRVRGVGRTGKEMAHRLEGHWSYGDIPINVSIVHQFEKELNWTYSVGYAEEGKRKEVISFFDGGGRSRQVVTKMNSTGLTFVSESIYDYEGRLAVSILPSPIENGDLEYYTSLNQVQGGGTFGKADFGLDAYHLTPGNIPTLSTISGAGQYYSINNPNKGNDAGYYVPDAEGYPYSVTQFDNQGRPIRSSGVGATHRLGGGHETEYRYTPVFQEELDELLVQK